MSGQRKALIVANDEYDQEALQSLLAPAADAEALARVLGDRQIGDFAVEVLRNEPAHVIQVHIEEFFSESRPDDVLLMFFSGHGLKGEAGELFLAARNTRLNRLASTAVSADFVRRCMRASRAHSIVLLLDCCYGGSVANGDRIRASAEGAAVRSAGVVNVLDSFSHENAGGGRGRAVITASNAMEYAFEGEQLAEDRRRRPSVFTNALVEGLATGDADRNQDGWVSLNELYDYVFDKLSEVNPHQTPSRNFEIQGEMYLARNPRRHDFRVAEAGPEHQAPEAGEQVSRPAAPGAAELRDVVEDNPEETYYDDGRGGRIREEQEAIRRAEAQVQRELAQPVQARQQEPVAAEQGAASLQPRSPSQAAAYDDLVRSAFVELVQQGRLLFNPPDRMQLGQTERVEVRLTRTLELDAELFEHLRGHGKPQVEEIPTAPLMAVTLKGDGFQITPYSDEEQSVTREGITTWEFDIQALKRGQQRLVMCVSLRIPVPGQPLEHKSIPVREAIIDVQVGAPALIAHFVSSNWQWFIGTAIAIAAVLVAVLYH